MLPWVAGDETLLGCRLDAAVGCRCCCLPFTGASVVRCVYTGSFGCLRYGRVIKIRILMYDLDIFLRLGCFIACFNWCCPALVVV